MNPSGISFTSASAQLAALIVESEAAAAERTDESLEAVQQRIARKADEEYKERMAAADASARAAWLGGAFTIAGGAATMGAGIAQSRALEPTPGVSAAPAGQPPSSLTATILAPTGQILSGLAPFAAEHGGQIEAERREARAQRAGRAIDQASVEADQLSRQAQRQQQRADTALDAARDFVQADHSRSNAVLSNG